MVRSIALFILVAAARSAVWGQATIVSIANAALPGSLPSKLPAGGALATAYVTGLSDLQPGNYLAPTNQPLPLSLGGVSVVVNNGAAPLLAVAVPSDLSQPVQINFQVPMERNASGDFPGEPQYAGFLAVSSPKYTALLTGLPLLVPGGAFFSNANGFAAALHATDSSPVTPDNPARPNEPIIAYANDFFRTWPPPPIGIATPTGIQFRPAPSHGSYADNLYLQAYFGGITICPPPYTPGTCPPLQGSGKPIQLTFLGLAPGKVGVEEVDFVVPANQQPGNWPLFFNAGGCADLSLCGPAGGLSSPYVLLPVGNPLALINSTTDQTTGQSCNLSQDPNCTLAVSQNDILQISGAGFSIAGGNTLHLTGSRGDWWLYEGDGYLFSDTSYTQITAQIACYLPPGPWTLSAIIPILGNSTRAYSIDIAGSSSCQ